VKDKLKNIIKRKNLFISLVISLVVLASSLSLLPILVRGSNGEKYWPTNEWTEVNPEQQGLDSNSISRMYGYIEDNLLDVHSVIIVRNGYLLTEKYFYNYQVRSEKSYNTGQSYTISSTLHYQFSTTKSIISLLIGIAIEEGYLDNLCQTLYEFFADVWVPSYNDKMNITIEQLLTHYSGIIYDEDSIGAADYIENALNEILYWDPGVGFIYSNDGVNLLSGIITNVTGQSAADFAREKLFEPMGITEEEWFWNQDDNNITDGAGGFICSPRVQAKLGILCLNNGTWNGTQLVPSNWVINTTTFQCWGSFDYSNWFKYGYLFYIDEEGYHTQGYGGQNIYIIPEYNIVVGFTGSNMANSTYKILINNYILQFSADSGGNIPGSPLIILMSIIVFAVGYQVLTLKKKIIR
jgi:CubicO group peptidase (beta-lactamase class C family)